MLLKKFEMKTYNFIIEMLVYYVCKKIKYEMVKVQPFKEPNTEMTKIRVEIKNLFDKLDSTYFKIDIDNDETTLREYFSTVDGISEHDVMEIYGVEEDWHTWTVF